MNIFKIFKKKKIIQNGLNENFQQILNYEKSTEFQLEDLTRNRTVGEILKSITNNKKYMAIKLLDNKKLIGKRQLQDFEILSDIVKNARQKKQIQFEVFLYKKKEINRNETLAQKNKYSITIRKQKIQLDLNPIYESQAKVRREDENIYLHQKLKIYKDKLVITKGQKNSKITQILYSQIQNIQIDPYQPSTIIIETSLLNYYLLFIKPDKTKKFNKILQENYLKYQKIQIGLKIKKLTNESTFNQTHNFLEISNFTIREIIQIKVLQLMYFQFLKENFKDQKQIQIHIEKIEQFIENFEIFDILQMNQLLKYFLESQIIDFNDLEQVKRKTSLKNQMISLYNSQTGETIIEEQIQEDFDVKNFDETMELHVDCYKNVKNKCLEYLSQFPKQKFFEYFFKELNREQLNELDKQVNQQNYGKS